MGTEIASRWEGSMVQAERRVVITGLGVVAANGIGKEAYWHATCNGVTGIKTISRFPTADLPVSVAGEVSNFVAEEYIDRKLAARSDRMTHFAFATIQEALQDAGIEIAQENPQHVGAVIANTVGGVEYVLEQIRALHVRGPRAMSAFTAIAWLPVSNVGQISVHYGLQGYCKTLVNDTAGGLDALGVAYGAIRRGAADVIITGGCEALLEPCVLIVLSHGDFCLAGNDPNAYRPFDRRAAGLLLGEGAGMCILEEYEHAVQRGAPIYGEIVGYGQTNDAHGLRNSAATGKHYARAMSLAMREGNIGSKDVAYFSLDGRANPVFDQREVEALRLTFGTDFEDIPASVPRTMLGHSYAAAGVLDAITALLALRYGVIPPTINCEELDPRYGLNLVQKETRPMSGSTVLIGGRGINGANVVLAIKAVN
jgi:3-oxoacyl-(acyl-carrier-protein) synthase